MRKVIKDFDDKPLSLTKQETLDHLKTILESKNSDNIKSDFYRGKYDKPDGTKGDEVVEKLEKIYFGKCAYCESNSEILIEHYRPKGRVIKTKHGGYFWLCYEWSNLLPACHDCNTIGKGKSDTFLVKNKHLKLADCMINQELDPDRIIAAYMNKIEEPYLLHPEIDEPENFLSFKIHFKKDGIALIGLDGVNERGEQTIKICNLNRESLLINRLKIISNFVQMIEIVIDFSRKDKNVKEVILIGLKIVFEKVISESKDVTKDFTLLRNFIIKNHINFELLVILQLQKSDKEIVREAFKLYKNGKL